jgi:hypothetical protein
MFFPNNERSECLPIRDNALFVTIHLAPGGRTPNQQRADLTAPNQGLDI